MGAKVLPPAVVKEVRQAGKCVEILLTFGINHSKHSRLLPQRQGAKMVVDSNSSSCANYHSFVPPRLLPQVQEKLQQYQGQPFTMQTMAVIKNLIEGW